jgi:hypothetical protein
MEIRDSPNLEGQVPVPISLRNRVVQLYTKTLGFFFVAPFDSHVSQSAEVVPDKKS